MLTVQDRENQCEVILESRGLLKRFKPGFMDYLKKIGYFTAPSSKSWHGVWPGGNFDHSLRVARNLVKLNRKMELKTRYDSVYLIGLFHDLCKSDLYIWDDTENRYINNPNTITCSTTSPLYPIDNRHAAKSIAMLEPWIDLTEEERLCIRFHMGAYETSDWGDMDEAIQKYQSVYWTHVADMMAAKIDGI